MIEFDSQEERRKIYAAVPFERRGPVSSDIHTRVAVLEIHRSNHADALNGLDASFKRHEDKLDSIQNTMGQVIVSVTNITDNLTQTNQSLKTIAEMATESRNAISKWDTIISTTFKIASVLAIVIGALFSLVKFVEDRNHEAIPVTRIPAHIVDEITTIATP
jgi:methyl-accepting chemotaxis protein